MLLTIYIAFILTALAGGLAGGWWLRSRGVRPADAPVAKDDVRRAQELLVGLQRMASSVASELGDHSSRVEEINGELADDALHEPVQILDVVTKLVDVNKTMQGRLDQAEDRLREQVRLVESHTAEARTDALTLVGNRRAFDSDIAQSLAEFRGAGRPFTLAIIDLDKFKRLNDTYGHQTGDEVLRVTGRVLRRVLRENASIARYGGEEFAVIFKQAAVADVQRALTRLRKEIAGTEFPGPSGKLNVTVSIGAARAAGEETVETIVQRADAALYASKEAGRNCGHWHDGRKIVPIVDEEDKPAPPITPERARADDAATERLADDLPPLLNRTVFCHNVRARMAERKRGGPTLTLVLVEIDNFERLVRTYGTKIRETLMVSLARVVFAGVREMDVVARYKAACLGLLLPSAELCNAVGVAERIREAASQTSFDSNGKKIGYTVSVGLIEAGMTDDLVALFRSAELALEYGHRHGGNCLFTHDSEQRQSDAVEVPLGA